MDRRTFLVSTGVVAAAAGVVDAAGPQSVARPAPEIRPDALVMGARLSRLLDTAYYRDIVDRFGLALAEASDGRLVLEYRPPMPLDTAHAALPGAASSDIWFGPVDELTGETPAFAYFAGLPADLGLSADLHRAWLDAAGGQMFWDDVAADVGLKPLMIGHTSGYAGAWTWRDLTLPDDFVGARAAATGMTREVARRLGADVSSVAGGAGERHRAFADRQLLYLETCLPFSAAMASGIGVDGAIWLRDGLRPEGSVLAAMVSLETWRRLPADGRSLLELVAARIDRQLAAEQYAHQALVAPHLKQSRAIGTARIGNPLTDAVRKAAWHAVEEMAAHSDHVRLIHNAYMAFRKEAAGLADPLSSVRGVA
jgi:TRAP-type mannitol/chloroaromatic compound transport system substrate-binding protein